MVRASRCSAVSSGGTNFDTALIFLGVLGILSWTRWEGSLSPSELLPAGLLCLGGSWHAASEAAGSSTLSCKRFFNFFLLRLSSFSFLPFEYFSDFVMEANGTSSANLTFFFFFLWGPSTSRPPSLSSPAPNFRFFFFLWSIGWDMAGMLDIVCDDAVSCRIKLLIYFSIERTTYNGLRRKD